MRFQDAFVLGLPALSAAYPGLMGAQSKEQIESMLLQKRVEEEKRDLIGGLIGTVGALTNTVGGLLKSVAAAVDPDNKRPEPGYYFQAPGPEDSRGPCPGLNLLANYGYLPRDGFVNYGQVLEATARGFNMGADLAAVLCTFAILTDGNITTESWYLGSDPTKSGGLNRHSTIEADVSPNREDFYLGCGDNHHLSSRIFKQNVGFAAATAEKQFTMEAMANQYAANAKFSKTYNPYLYAFPFPQIVSVVAFAFYPNFFSNGTYGAGGVANYESISNIIGAQYDSETGEFKYVPEKWPENWYRRSTPYDVVNSLADGFLSIYPKYPLVPGVAQLGGPNLTPQTILCDLYQGLQSITPLVLSGAEQDVAGAITWAVGKLASAFGSTVLGCPASTLTPSTPFLYPNASNKGGPLGGNLGASPAKISNNVYNKVYFTKAPTSPQC